MKRHLKLAIMCLLLISCSADNLENLESEKIMAPVKVHVSDFSMSVNDFADDGSGTRTATSAADYTDVGAITLAFYKGSAEVYKTTQVRADGGTYTTFGEFSLSLPIGSYTMVVVGYGFFSGDEFTLTSPTSASFSPKARETFVKTQTVNITSADAKDISATLDRIVSKLMVVSTDGRSDDVASLKVTFAAGGKSFNPTTGLATVNTGFSNTVNVSAATGSTSSTTCFLFLGSNEQTMDVTVETLDANGNTIYSKTIQSVPLMRNRVTTLSGPLYNTPLTGAFQVNTEWVTGNTVNF